MAKFRTVRPHRDGPLAEVGKIVSGAHKRKLICPSPEFVGLLSERWRRLDIFGGGVIGRNTKVRVAIEATMIWRF